MASRTIAGRWRMWVWYQHEPPESHGAHPDSVRIVHVPDSPPPRPEDYVPGSPPPREPELCPICYDEIGSYSAKTPCGHLFCTGCILRSSQENGNCPMCRAEIIPPSEKKYTQSDLLDAESDGIRQGFHDSQELYSEERIAYRIEIEQLRNSLAAAATQVNNYASTCFRLREKFDFETQKSYDDGVRDGRRIQMETQKMSAVGKSSL